MTLFSTQKDLSSSFKKIVFSDLIAVLFILLLSVWIAVGMSSNRADYTRKSNQVENTAKSALPGEAEKG